MSFLVDEYSSEEENNLFLKMFFILFFLNLFLVIICFFLLPNEFLINYGSKSSHHLVSWNSWKIFIITPLGILSMLIFRPLLINQFLRSIRKDEDKIKKVLKNFNEYDLAAKMRDTLILTISSVLIFFNFGFVLTQPEYKSFFFLNFVILAIALFITIFGYKYFYKKLDL